MWRWLTTVALACGVWLGVGTTAAAAQGTGYSVTFAARQCASYSDIFANRFRDNLMQTLQNVGPDSPYGPNDLVNPSFEDTSPADQLHAAHRLGVHDGQAARFGAADRSVGVADCGRVVRFLRSRPKRRRPCSTRTANRPAMTDRRRDDVRVDPGATRRGQPGAVVPQAAGRDADRPGPGAEILREHAGRPRRMRSGRCAAAMTTTTGTTLRASPSRAASSTSSATSTW